MNASSYYFFRMQAVRLLLLLSAFASPLRGQDAGVEHLLLELHRTTSDSMKVKFLLELAERKLEKEAEKSYMYAQQAHFLSEKNKMTREMGYASLRMAIAARRLGIHDKVAGLFSESLALLRLAGDSSGVGEVYTSQGIMFYRVGQYQKALDNYRKALSCFNQAENLEKQAKILLENAVVLISLKQFEESRKIFRQVQEIAQETNNQFILSDALRREGQSYIKEGKNEQALAKTKEALRVAVDIQDLERMSKAWNNIGFTENLMGNYQKAQNSLQKSLDIKKNLRDDISKVPTLNNLGISFLRLGKPAEALPFSLESYQISAKYNLTERLWESSLTLTEIYQKMGDLENALKFQKLSFAWKDSLDQDLQSEKMQVLLDEFNKEKQAMEQDIIRQKASEESFRKMSLLLGVMVILVFFGGISFWMYQKRKKA